MRIFTFLIAVILLGSMQETYADPSFECSIGLGSQVEIAACVAKTETAVEKTIEMTLGFASNAATELDEATGRSSTLPALEKAQEAWSAFRQAHCDYVGSTFGGGSGTGIAIRSCRVELGRTRVKELMGFAQ